LWRLIQPLYGRDETARFNVSNEARKQMAKNFKATLATVEKKSAAESKATTAAKRKAVLVAAVQRHDKKSDGDGYSPQAESVTWRRVCDMRPGEYKLPNGTPIALGGKDSLRGVIGKRTHETHRLFCAAYAAGRGITSTELAQAGIDAVSPHLNSMKDREFIARHESGRGYTLTARALERIKSAGGLVPNDGLLCEKPKGAAKPKKGAKK
jgi:hypothetical protein